MNPHAVSMLFIPLSFCPDRTFQIVGFIKSIDIGLKKTVISVITTDRTKATDNTDQFSLSLYGQIKSIGDRILNKEDLVMTVGNLNQVDSELELEVKYFMSWNSMMNIWESDAVNVPVVQLPDLDLAY